MSTQTRTAPRTLHAVAAYIVVPHDGEPTDYYRPGDPVISDSLGWEYWPDGMEHDYGKNKAHAIYTGWAANANTPDEDGGRIGALLTDVTVPEDVRAAYEAAATDEGAFNTLADWMDGIEWDSDWISPHVEILAMTPAFRENRERIIAARAAKENAA